MNAVKEFAAELDRGAIVATLGRRGVPKGASAVATQALRQRLVHRYQDSLARFLNCTHRQELETFATAHELETIGSIGGLRARLWLHGAELEAGSADELGSPWQPVPIVLGSRLVYQGPVRGQCPLSDSSPRIVPEAVTEPAVPSEPDSLEGLLANASRLLGLRLGERGPDKGYYGSRIAELLGVRELGFAEPDWRGEVEIKTVPVVHDLAGWWRVKEDPAIAMADVDPLLKLRRVLWVARVADCASSPILSWYYQEWDAKVAQLAQRYLHHRPKGPAGTSNKGWYLQKRFFLYSGFLKSLNG